MYHLIYSFKNIARVNILFTNYKSKYKIYKGNLQIICTVLKFTLDVQYKKQFFLQFKETVQ